MKYIQDIPQKRLNYAWAQSCQPNSFSAFREGEGLLYYAFQELKFYGVKLISLQSDNSAVEALEEIADDNPQFHKIIQERWDNDDYDMYSLEMLKATFPMAKPSLDNMIIIRSHFCRGVHKYAQMHKYSQEIGSQLFGYDATKPIAKGNSIMLDTRSLELNTKEDYINIIQDIMDDLNQWRSIEDTQIITTEEYFRDCIENHKNMIYDTHHNYENRCLYLALCLPKNDR